MIKIIGIMGDTGYGKSLSPFVPPDGKLKTDSYGGLDPSTLVIFNLDGKELPITMYTELYPKWKEAINDLDKRILEPNIDDFLKILTLIIENKPEIKNIIIDTFSFGMFRERMKHESKTGYEKWSKMNIKFWKIIEELRKNKTVEDIFIWIFFHIEEGKNREGDIVYQAKVEGNLLRKVAEKSITNMFFATKNGKDYIFETQADGTTAKNPPLLFPFKIPNSLKLIEDVLRYKKIYKSLK